MKKFYDVIFVGAGLANGLAGYRLHQMRPDIEFLILDPSDTFGGNHTWSFHENDLTQIDFSWIQPFISRSWDGTDVMFPKYRRTVSGRYHSVRSSQFHEVLKAAFHYQIGLKHAVADVYEDQVLLEDGTTVHAGCVIDGRGWKGSSSQAAGYQKFAGLDLKLKVSHGLTRPIIMDATSSQEDGFRFFYVLPWSDNELLVEDTRYSDTPDLDEAAYHREILAYAVRRGWEVAEVGRSERGCLSIPLDGDAPQAEPGIVFSGSRAGLFHATTGYSLPDAARFADAFSGLKDFSGAAVSAWSAERARRHWRGQAFFRLLNRLMFRAASPPERYKVLESFYRREDPLIARFYAGRLNTMDRLRMFSGTPPVPIAKAIRQLLPCARPA